MLTFDTSIGSVCRGRLGLMGCLLLLSITVHGQQSAITPETALYSYLNNGDKTYDWEIRDSLVFDEGTIFQVLLRSEEHTSELQSLMRISYAVFCLKKKKKKIM